MKNTFYFIVVLSILYLSAQNCLAESINIKPGLWETCGHFEISGQQAYKNCKLECFAEFQGDKILFPSEDGHVTNMDSSDICDISKYTSSGTTVTWEVQCLRDKLPVQTGHFQYKDKTFSGRITASEPDSNNTIVTVSNGRFLTSDCSKRDSEEFLSK